MVELWVGDVGADSWGRDGLGLSSERSLPGRNVLSDGVSLCYFSIVSFSVVGWSLSKMEIPSKGWQVWG